MNPVAFRVAVTALIPVLMALAYFGLIASDRYVSESSVVLRSGNQSTSTISLGGLLPVSNPDAQDVLVVSDYILSMEMAKHLDEKFNLREHYSDKNIDFVARLDKDTSDEGYLDYLQNMVGVSYEETSSIIAITTKAFTAQLAQDINREIILRSEMLINRLSDRIAEDTLNQARMEVEGAISNARDISGRLSRFTNQNQSINPGVDATSIAGLIGMLEGKLAETRALYTERSAYMRDTAPEIRSLRNRINGLEFELKRERSRLSDETGVGTAIEQYKPLVVEEELGRQRYAAALQAYETARVESQTQKRYLATFVNPSLPSSSTEPDRFFDALSSILLSFLLYAIFALFRAAIREHIDFAV